MTAIVTSDWHLAANLRDAYRHDWQLNLRKIIEERRPKQLIMLGDITETKDNHGAELVNEIVGYFHYLSTLVEDVFILRGNHDGSNPEHSFFAFLGKVHGIHWIDHPAVHQIGGLGICVFLPHTRDYKKDWKEISFDPFERDPNCGFIFAHNTFAGSMLAPGHVTQKGIPLDVFPMGATVISGDVHVPQTFGCVTYVGSPYTIDFGDSFKPRVLEIGITPKRRIEKQSILCTGVQKRLIEVESVATLDRAAKKAGVCKRDIVKVRCHWDGKDMSQWPAVKKQIAEWAAENKFVLHIIEPVISATQRRSIKYKPAARLDDDALLGQYCKRHKLSEPLQKTARRIIRSE